MKVLTIKQPWATLIMQGDKRFEFRSWQTKYRGDLLIHAGKGIDKEAMKRLAKYIPKDMPSGKILGKVTLVHCIKCDDDFKGKCLKENKDVYAKSTFIEKFAWQLENVEIFDEPIEAKGKLSLWEYDI
ncbi:MAG: ASCH domain-containing protein [Clostridia bacterium]|nr:ASCH domain-containing protein [Clostridia bacterium]